MTSAQPDFSALAAPQDGSYLGFAAIEQLLGLAPVQPLTTTVLLGRTRAEVSKNGFTKLTLTSQYVPRPDLRGHFEFGLKYDDLNLEWLARFFAAVDPTWIEQWLADTPTSSYARRTAFLYEWFTGRQLNSADTTASSYEDLLDPERYLVATAPERNRRWKINNNLPGTPAYCPLVRWTPELREASQFDVQAALERLDSRFGSDLLLRSAAWLTFAESRASFAIEREADRTNDIQRFAAAMTLYCGKIEEPLSAESLVILQREVLGTRALRTGVRRSPVFVGSAAHHEATIVRYIAPPYPNLPELLEGLRAFDARSRGSSPLVRAAVLAFGFVYIHPLADGNGRVHRLLINDTLLRDGAVPPGVILPVSATIVERRNFGAYDQLLDSLSNRQVRRFNARWRFTAEERECEDGVFTDFEFDADDECLPFWRYPDLTHHSLYLCQIVRRTVEHNMTEEASFLARHDEALQRVKKVWEMPDRDAERIIRSLRDNNGTVTNMLAKQYPQLFSADADPVAAGQLMEAVMSAFESRPMDKFEADSED